MPKRTAANADCRPNVNAVIPGAPSPKLCSPKHRARISSALLVPVMIAGGLVSTVGCHDGPLYQLKKVNPFYVSQWNADKKIGVTDTQRRDELQLLASSVGSMSAAEQAKWIPHLNQLIENDPNVEMRRLAVRAAGRISDPRSMDLIKRGLDDDAAKVRMQACSSLGNKSGDDAARLLVATIGTEGNLDVKHSAMEALGNFQSPIASQSLRTALVDSNPATKQLAMESLRGVTGKDYGDDPSVWIAALDGQEVEEPKSRIAEVFRGIF